MKFATIGLLCGSLIACGFTAVAQAQSVANLPLTCPSAAAIGQPQSNCSGLLYQQPTSDQMIVLRSNSTWARAATLAGTDTLTVCTLAVQPGTYSSCRDSAGVRRLTQLPKSQIFTASTLPPTPPNSGARIIDLSRPPVEITEQGLYVFDRNWNVVPSFLDGTIVITADNVTLDLQGFELSTEELAIRSTGRGVTVRNGRVNAAFGGAIRVSGADSLIERVEADVGHGGAIHLGGAGSTLSESSVSVGEFATGVHAGDDTIVRGNRLGSRFIALSAASRTTLVDNEILCGIADPCIEVEGTENIISRNAIRETVDVAAVGIAILGDNNHAMDNLFLPDCDFPPSGLTAIAVEGRGNTVRDNLLAGCSGFAGWAIGLRFTRDGNFYGDNVMWATSPFSVGATVQRDLGGNAGFSN